MATIVPFKALRPKPELALKLASRPYDVLNSAEARQEVKGNPVSFLHITKAEVDLPADLDIHATEVYAKAKDKKIQPNEFSGNTFTISNLGMMDIDEFTAIINPPDSCIMAVGRIKEVVVKKPEGFGISNVMKITMSCDHRSVDGATGAAFLQTFKKYMENPVMIKKLDYFSKK